MAPRPTPPPAFDRELNGLPAELRWREWMGRVEAIVFSAPRPVPREALARVIGTGCNLDRLIEDIRTELQPRPYELVTVAGGAYQMRTRIGFRDSIHTAAKTAASKTYLSQRERLTLVAIAYYQPVTRSDIAGILGTEVSRDTIARLRSQGLVGPGPRSPQPGAPYTYVTTDTFLTVFGLGSIYDLPDMAALEEAGLLERRRGNTGFPGIFATDAGSLPEPDDEHDPPPPLLPDGDD